MRLGGMNGRVETERWLVRRSEEAAGFGEREEEAEEEVDVG